MPVFGFTDPGGCQHISQRVTVRFVKKIKCSELSQVAGSRIYSYNLSRQSQVKDFSWSGRGIGRTWEREKKKN